MIPKWKWKISYPTNLKLEAENGHEVVFEAAKNIVEQHMRDSVAVGEDVFGNPLHVPRDGGQPLNRTGQFMNSIQTRKGRGKKPKSTVKPHGKTPQGWRYDVLAKILQGTIGAYVIAAPREIRKRVAEYIDKNAKWNLVEKQRKTVRK